MRPVTLVLALSLLGAPALAAPSSTPPAPAVPPPAIEETATVAQIEAERQSLRPYEIKLDTHLRRLLRAYHGEQPPLLAAARAAVPEDAASRVEVLIESDRLAGLITRLQQPDVSVSFADSEAGYAQVWAPLSLVDELARRDDVRFIRPAIPPQASVTSEGDTILGAQQARAATGLSGAGIRVGVISNSADGLADSIANKELPADTEVIYSPPESAEGTAMMEIVHDLAPGAGLSFCSGNGPTQRAFRALQAAGCRVIVDDIGSPTEPWFEDGPSAREAASSLSQGVTLVSACGNNAQRHYIGTYQDSGTAYHITNAHAFAPQRLDFTVRLQGGSRIMLQWDDPWNAPVNDYDLYVLRMDGTIIACSNNNQSAGTGHPYESVSLLDGRDARVVIQKRTGSAARLRILFLGELECVDAPVASGSIFGQAAVPGVISVAALGIDDPAHSTIEDFSSRGPVEIRYPAAEQRVKPDVSGVDGVATSLPGFNPFGGTSAAAPHVAAVAALLKEASPSMTPAQVRDALVQTCADLGAPGTDNVFGAGQVNAEAALAWIRPNVTASPTSLTLHGYEGRSGATAARILLENSTPLRGGEMVWSAAATVPWLHLDRSSGRALGADAFVVWADTTELTAPGASGSIVITLRLGSPSSITIPVQLWLTSPDRTIVVNATEEDPSNPSATLTLREAIAQANEAPGATIQFKVPASDRNFTNGVVTFPKTTGQLGIIQPGTLIDGTSQTSYLGNTNAQGPEVQIKDALYFNSPYNCVRGVVLNDTPFSPDPYIFPAITFEGPNANGNTVLGCYIGCDPTGQTPVSTQAGVDVIGGSSNRVGGLNPGERNIISGSTSAGVVVGYGASLNVVTGNWIGLNATGTKRLGSGITGIQLQLGADSCVIGGSEPGAGNVVSGHMYGIVLWSSPVRHNHILGNRVGTNPDGTAAIPNSKWGVTAYGGPILNDIGGAEPGEGNVISGNGEAGVVLMAAGTSYNRILGNRIGTQADGVHPLPNGTASPGGGIALVDGASENVIGGTWLDPRRGNLIAANNGPGVALQGKGTNNNAVIGNAIGCTQLVGGDCLPNTGPGVYIADGAARNPIGGMDPVEDTAAEGANHIACNGGPGVVLTSDVARVNTVSHNSIHNNTGLGIDLGDDGRPQAVDDPYYMQPVLSAAWAYDGFTVVLGQFDPGTDAGSIEFYSSPGDPANHGGGQRYLLSIPVTKGGRFVLTLPPLPAGSFVSALAIRTGGTDPGDTSEFSNAVDVKVPGAGVAVPPEVGLIEPNGGTVITAGERQQIAWTADVFGYVQDQSIDYSLDAGATWTELPNIIPTDVRSWAWLAPEVETEHARIRIRVRDGLGTEAQDESDTDFAIHMASPFAKTLEALQIAGGLLPGSPEALSRLDAVTASPSAGRIDLQDAAALARRATGLDP